MKYKVYRDDIEKLDTEDLILSTYLHETRKIIFQNHEKLESLNAKGEGTFTKSYILMLLQAVANIVDMTAIAPENRRDKIVELLDDYYEARKIEGNI